MPLYSLKDVPTPSRYPRAPDYKYIILSTAVIKYIIANTKSPVQNVPRGTLEKIRWMFPHGTLSISSPLLSEGRLRAAEGETMPIPQRDATSATPTLLTPLQAR